MSAEITVYLIDNDDAVRDRVASSLKNNGYRVSPFASGQPFLDKIASDSYGCIVLDLQLPDMCGLEIQTTLAAQGFKLPIIFVTGHGNIQSSVSALKNGALDFIEKPFQIDTLLEQVKHAAASEEVRRDQEQDSIEVIECFAMLTKREVEIMAELVRGIANHSSKSVAAELGISHRTVEVYRSRIFHKMNASSITHLVEMAKICGIHSA